MAMPAIVYLLAISAALHAVNYYLEARRDAGARRRRRACDSPRSAADAAGRLGRCCRHWPRWPPATLFPIQKFGVFTAVCRDRDGRRPVRDLPMVLHRFPLSDATVERRTARRAEQPAQAQSREAWSAWLVARGPAALACWVIAARRARRRHAPDSTPRCRCSTCSTATRISFRTTPGSRKHLGNLVPMEVVLTMPPERLRAGDEHAEQDGQQYRLTMLERLELLRQIERRLEEFPQISRALSAATFAPAGDRRPGWAAPIAAATTPRTRPSSITATSCWPATTCGWSASAASDRLTGRELWRLNARVAAAPDGDQPRRLRRVSRTSSTRPSSRCCWPTSSATRSCGPCTSKASNSPASRVCVLFRAPNRAAAPPAEVQEHALAELARDAAASRRAASPISTSPPSSTRAAATPPRTTEYRQSARRLAAQAGRGDPRLGAERPRGSTDRRERRVRRRRHRTCTASPRSMAAPLADDGGPRPIRAVFTGLAPVVERTQRQLVGELASRPSAGRCCLAAAVVTLGYMSVVCRRPGDGSRAVAARGDARRHGLARREDRPRRRHDRRRGAWASRSKARFTSSTGSARAGRRAATAATP